MAVVHYDRLPAHLVEPTAVSDWLGNTNEDLVEYALDLRSSVEACNADKAALRRIWSQSEMQNEALNNRKSYRQNSREWSLYE